LTRYAPMCYNGVVPREGRIGDLRREKMADNYEISNTILQQLGGNKFVAMTGARKLVTMEQGLRFRLPDQFAISGINQVVVLLDPTDDYTVRFERSNVRARVPNKVVSEYHGVYADQLQSLFTKVTGLDTHL
jgi:hypothetical protein